MSSVTDSPSAIRESGPAASSVADAARAQLVEILVRTGDEDRAAFRDLYSLTSAKLFGVCLRICGERQAAEDVLHDVYLTIWKRAGAYEPSRASPITWLSTIARNRAIDWRRAQTIRRSTPIEDAPPIADAAPLASDTVVADQEAHRLHHCLDRLEARQRGAIRTAFFDGVTYADLAERENVPLGTMKSWVRRGLMKLKECLEK
ncbi:MAG: sigma-70 family RNA polymerase sigma factor [Pseudomonadota bacterium]|uniref:sigma-70 family RNA polymerase sigma factor n=1 Tax=Sphingomonas sp. ERG5 TaxID=1381597 RepID=UPI0009DE899E|nr:sigma-70 family RNA polymerase sigma factor [Sphingomonas sp. ERG5]